MPTHFDPADLGSHVLEFLTERHLATFTTTTGTGRLQSSPVGFTFDAERVLARVITWGAAHKARTVAASPGVEVVLCQVDGGRWLAVYGRATLATDPDSVAEGERRYTERYRPPKQREDRVVIEIEVDRLIGRVPD